MNDQIVALDHFAGTGWGVACRQLGIREYGVELMPEAIATRDAAGFETAYHDVWEGLFNRSLVPAHDLYIASPPCQTFSVAGRGSGRQALDQVLALIAAGAWRHPARLKAAGLDLGDDRTALVLTPLAHIWTHRPQLIALEQVPTVLPVWEAIADVLRGLGYSVWAGNMQAEQYGVPQTRKRAILVARADGRAASAPSPTHSRYYSHNPSKLDAGVRKWVSMAEAFGIGGFVAEKVMGSGMVERFGDRPGRDSSEPAFTIRASAGGREPGGFVLVSNYGTGGDASARGERSGDEPAPTITSKADRNKWDGVRKMTAAEAATLQSFPAGFPFQGGKGKQFLQIGNAVPPVMAAAIIGELVARGGVTPTLELAGAVAAAAQRTPYASSSTPWWAEA